MSRLTEFDLRSVSLMLAADLVVVMVAANRPSALSMFVLVIVGAPVVAAVLDRPQRGVLIVVAIAPFEGLLQIVTIPHGTSIVEAIVVLTFAASLLARNDPAGSAVPSLPDWLPAFVAFLALGLLSALVVRSSSALFGLKTVYFYAILGWACWRCPLGRRDRDHLVSILMITGVVTAGYGLYQQLLGGTRLHDLGYPYNSTIRFAGDYLRSFSTFVQPFGFGLFQALVLVVCLPVALADRTRLRNQLFLLVIPLLVAGLVSSIVRAAWIAAAVGVAYVVSSRHRALLLLVPLVAGAALLLPSEAVQTAVSTSSGVQRTQGWQENAHLVGTHPLGLGIGSTGSAVITAAEHGADVQMQYQPDNWYVKLLLEVGPIGLWLWGMFFVGIVFDTMRASKRLTDEDGAFAAGVTAMLLGAAAASLVATYFEIFPLDLLFWVLVVATARMDRDGTEIAARPELAREAL